jgi:hypothetical protein
MGKDNSLLLASETLDLDVVRVGGRDGSSEFVGSFFEVLR